MQRAFQTGVKEECGVFGIFDLDGNPVSTNIYYGLSALQHRGQESCGICVSSTYGPKGQVRCHKGLGLVHEVFSEKRRLWPRDYQSKKTDWSTGSFRA